MHRLRLPRAAKTATAAKKRDALLTKAKQQAVRAKKKAEAATRKAKKTATVAAKKALETKKKAEAAASGSANARYNMTNMLSALKSIEKSIEDGDFGYAKRQALKLKTKSQRPTYKRVSRYKHLRGGKSCTRRRSRN
jgi:membrane protein involved in colicin uptake